MWKYIDEGGSWIPGVPAQDLSDEDMDRLDAEYCERGGFEPGAIKACGLYEYAAGDLPADVGTEADTEADTSEGE